MNLQQHLDNALAGEIDFYARNYGGGGYCAYYTLQIDAYHYKYTIFGTAYFGETSSSVGEKSFLLNKIIMKNKTTKNKVDVDCNSLNMCFKRFFEKVRTEDEKYKEHLKNESLKKHQALLGDIESL